MARAKERLKPKRSKKSRLKNAARIKANNEILKKYAS
jgi:hypothetical protein